MDSSPPLSSFISRAASVHAPSGSVRTIPAGVVGGWSAATFATSASSSSSSSSNLRFLPLAGLGFFLAVTNPSDPMRPLRKALPDAGRSPLASGVAAEPPAFICFVASARMSSPPLSGSRPGGSGDLGCGSMCRSRYSTSPRPSSSMMSR